jgi:hypothetical protein
VAVHDAVRGIGPHLRGIAEAVGEAGWPRLEALLRALYDADGASRGPRARELVDFLVPRLAPDHPVLVALARVPADLGRRDELGGRNRRPRGDGPALDDAVAQFRAELAATVRAVDLNPNPPGVLASVQADLLAAAHLTPVTLVACGGDPQHRHLIRLPSPAGDVVLPAFQFGAGGSPHSVVLAVNELLGAEDDPWGVASWWLDRNAWLGAVAAELVGHIDDVRLLDAARADLEVD